MSWFGKARKADAEPRPVLEAVRDIGQSTTVIVDDVLAIAQRDERAGHPGAALRALNEAIGRYPDDSRLWLARGSVYYEWTRFHEAYVSYRAGLQRFPEDINLLARCAWASHATGRSIEAETLMRRVVALRPNEADAHYGLAVALRALKQFQAAREHFEATIACDPRAVHAYVNLGVTLMDLGRFDEAEEPLRKAIELAPDSPGNWVNLGVNLYRQSKDGAEIAYRTAQELETRTGEFVDAFVSYASFLRNTGRLDEAIEQYRTFLGAHPNTAGLTQLGMCLLHKGKFREGWSLYEFRWLQDPLVSLRANLETPLWQGQDIRGKTILVRAEQGVGDVIQFARYMKEVRRLGARVLFQGRDGMEELSQRFEGVDQIINSGQALPPFDFYTNLMSLPRFFGDDPAALGPCAPYVRVDPEATAAFHNRLDPSKLNIGVVWAGNPTHLLDNVRSMPLAALMPIAKLPDVRLVSLQKGDAAKQVESFEGGSCVDDWNPLLRHFGDTADAIEALDLVISVDTSVAHLAGALGKSVWVLLPKPAEWRWMDERRHSDWYVSARLFRQSQPGDWTGVIRDVANALEQRDALRKRNALVARDAISVTSEMVAPMGVKPPEVSPELSAICEMREGIFAYYANPSDDVGVSLAWYGEWLHEQLALLASLVKLNQFVLELGSGIGVHALALSRLIGPEGHLIALENNEVTRRLLAENLRANKARNVTVMQRQYRTYQTSGGRPETIDDLELQSLDWLKINDYRDVGPGLDGAVETIWRTRPKIFANVAENAANVVGQLAGLGYSCWRHWSRPFREDNFNRNAVPVRSHQPQCAILAIPEEVVIDVELQNCEAVRATDFDGR